MKTNLHIEFDDIKYEAVRLVGLSNSAEIRFNDGGMCFCHYHRFTLDNYIDKAKYPITLIYGGTKHFINARLHNTEFNLQGIAVKTKLELVG